MPVYEYSCDACGGRFEVVQKFNESPITTCRLCNAGAVRKVLSAPAFVLKGSGWYVTDYPSADRKKAAEAEKTVAPAESKTPACASGSCSSGASCSSKS